MATAGRHHDDISGSDVITPAPDPRIHDARRAFREKSHDSASHHTSASDPDRRHQASGSTGRHPPRLGGVASREPTRMLAAVSTASTRAERILMISFMTGGDDGIRTHDPLLAKQVL